MSISEHSEVGHGRRWIARLLAICLPAFYCLVPHTISSEANTVEFAPVKFQEEKKYHVSISQVGTTRTSSLDSSTDKPSPGKDQSIQTEVALQLVLETFTSGEEGKMPVRMMLESWDSEVKSGGRSTPMSIPRQQLQRTDYRGWIDKAGAITFVNDQPTIQVGSIRFNILALLQLIPQLPRGEYAVGESFRVTTFLTVGSAGQGAHGKPASVNYRIAKIEGENVRLESSLDDKFSEKTNGTTSETAIEMRGKAVYSLRYKICRKIEADVAITTVVRGKGPKEGTTKVGNSVHLTMDIREVQ